MDREIRRITKEYWTAISDLASNGNEEAQKICRKPMSRIVMAKLGVKRPKYWDDTNNYVNNCFNTNHYAI